MFGSTILDVAVGLIFFYFLFSMIASHINEFIASRMQWRANDLENQIRHMLGDPDLANKVLQSPMITSITSKSGKPSYIPPNTFALALFDAFVPEGQNSNVFDHVRAGIVNSLPTNKGSQAVLNIVDRADGNMTKARANAEEWFNAAMDRVSGAYKRRIQVLTLFVSLALVAIVGADSLAIADALYKEPSVRAAVTGAAQAAPSNAQVSTNNQPNTLSSLQQANDLLQKSGFPLGWGDLPTDLAGWLKKILGLLITTLAVSLGAPFWFDLLKNVASLRSSGPPPAVASADTVTVATAAVSTSPASAAPPAAPAVAPSAAPPQAKYPGGI
jgi:hypothetical protein